MPRQRGFRNAKRVTLLLFLIFLFPIFFIYCQDRSKENQNNMNLAVAMDDLTSDTYSYLDSLGIEVSKVKIIYGRYIKNRHGALMEKSFKKAIIKLFPSPNDTGIGVIDWEGRTYKALMKKNKNPKLFSIAQSEFLKAIQLAKELRPKVKWGFYNIPFPRRAGGMTQTKGTWSQNIENNIRLIKESDVLITSLYFTYQVGTANKEKKMMKGDLMNLLKLAKEYSKEAIVFIWHRNNYSKKYKHLRGNYLDDIKTMEKVPLVKFNNVVKMIKNSSYEDKKVDLIVWWGADFNMYKHGNPNIKRAAAGNHKKFEHDYNETVKKYATELMKSIDNK